jgi:hypothetical protein
MEQEREARQCEKEKRKKQEQLVEAKRKCTEARRIALLALNRQRCADKRREQQERRDRLKHKKRVFAQVLKCDISQWESWQREVPLNGIHPNVLPSIALTNWRSLQHKVRNTLTSVGFNSKNWAAASTHLHACASSHARRATGWAGFKNH